MSRFNELVCLAADNIDGRYWYTEAQAEIAAICKLENWSPEYFAGIIATTSPRVSVRRNVRIALHYCHTGDFLANVMRGIRTSVAKFTDNRTISGLKTMPFWQALCGDSSAIVLDTHMANLLAVPQKLFATKGGNRYYAGIIAGVASELGIANAEAQACLWYGQFRRIGRNPELFPIMAEYHNWLGHNREFPQSGVIANDIPVAYSLFDDNSIEFDTAALSA